MQTFEEWAMNTVFGTYAWNASPVDGTNVQRAFGATGQHFKFPLDNTAISLSDARSKNRISRGSSGQATMEHIDTMFPLFWRQKELLKALNDERREHHRTLKNKTRTQRTFTQGDIVMVQKQVQSNASEGIPAKLVLKAKGPYRVIEKASEDSYYHNSRTMGRRSRTSSRLIRRRGRRRRDTDTSSNPSHATNQSSDDQHQNRTRETELRNHNQQQQKQTEIRQRNLGKY
mmetsp:Transcript_42019/g.101254  ORF Transcript_42019/g.101254 Transcript_42019/m.101254 type:complete len:230 (-) Transcript_42019:28-717(-)